MTYSGREEAEPLRIDILGRTDRNTIRDGAYPAPEPGEIRLGADRGAEATSNVRVLFEPAATRLLLDVISWGEPCRPTDVEQAGALIGNYYRDTTGPEEILWACVTEVIPADPTLVTATFEKVDITNEAWARMHEEAARFVEQNMQLVGWYHTHLGQYNTRFSSLDLETQRTAFTYPYSFAAVFNPNQRKWSVFYGPESLEGSGELRLDAEAAARYKKLQIVIQQVHNMPDGTDGISMTTREAAVQTARPPALQTNLEANPQSTPKTEEEILSLGQVFGQLFNSMGQRMHRRRTDRPPATEGSGRFALRREKSGPGSADRDRAEPLRIDIRGIDRSKAAIYCSFYSIGSDGSCIPQKNYGCTLSEETVQAILYHRTDKDFAFWGSFTHEQGGHCLSLAREEQSNARIIITRGVTDLERIQLVALGLEKTNPKLSFVVLIEERQSGAIDVRIVHLRRQNII